MKLGQSAFFALINYMLIGPVTAKIDCQNDPSGVASHEWVMECAKISHTTCPYQRGGYYSELGGRVFYIDDQCNGWVYADQDASDEGVDCISYTKTDEGHCYKWSKSDHRTYAGFKMVTRTDKNTAILKQQDAQLTNYPAVRACKEFNEGGFSNWRLPSADLLNLVYQLAYSYPHDDSFTYSGQTPYYWSSTEYSTENAWEQNFANEKQFTVNKNSYYRVRCVRTF